MSANVVAIPEFSRKKILSVYAIEAKCEFLKALRLPAYIVPTLSFPLLFYIMFVLVFGPNQMLGSVTMAAYLLASYGSFGVIGASMFGFGIGVATERGYGWLQLKRASPMPPFAYFAAKTVMSLLFSSILVLALFILAAFFGGVRLSAVNWLELAAVLVAGSIPFCALGLAIGYLAGPSSAPAIVNLIYLPLAFCSGLWIPLPVLPKFLQRIAPWLPPYHLGQMAQRVVAGEHWGSAFLLHSLALAGFTALFLLLARLGYNRDDVKMYG